jgi:SAM-dependent methyltransferase
LKKFDDGYFDLYPYLYDHIPFKELKGKTVLEVGLGYGSVSQKLAEAGAYYQGLDIADGPVSMVNHRLRQLNLSGQATVGSILEPPFNPESFDAIVAIGCLHHTGNLRLGIEQCRELLRPGGKFIFMVYYAYSYRRWRMAFKTTLSYFFRELGGYVGVVGDSGQDERAAYDSNSSGECAPHTDWISVRSLKKLCHRFNHCTMRLENIDQEPPFSKKTRASLLKTHWPRLMGLDIYVKATK